MTPEKHDRAWGLFLDGLEMSADERAALLYRECAEDEELQAHIEKLWKHDAEETALPKQLNAEQAAERVELDFTGRITGPYRIVERVGAGGMGTVYRATDLVLERDVALKFPAAHLLGDPKLRSRFLREGKAAAALEHPNICTVFGTGDLQGSPYIAMAFLQGQTLEARLRRGAMSLEEALDTAIQAARGLAAAHEKGVVHRDIKPSNLMLIEQTGGWRTVKILDFGIAQLENASRLTLTTAALGTTSYIPPEQTYSEDVDHRGDIWALGVVLYEMLTGRRPFEGPGASEIIQAIRTKRPERVSLARPGLPPELDAVLERALAKPPADRYQSVTEMADDLRSLNVGDPTVARLSAKRRPPSRVTLLAVVAAIAVTLALWERSPDPPPEPLASRPLTSDPGHEWGPSFSPDGRTLAYSAASPGSRDSDLFVQMLSGGAPLRIAPTEQAEFSPAWSPDGTQIAFLRSNNRGAHQVCVVSSLGGVDRVIGSVNVPSARQIWLAPPHLNWAPDGKWLAAVDNDQDYRPFFIVSLDLATGAKRRLTNPPEGLVGDLNPRFSPDGTKMAFVRYHTNSVTDVMVADVAPNGFLSGPPRAIRVGRHPFNSAPVWTPTGEEILLSSGSVRLSHLWAVAADGKEQPRLVSRMDQALRMLTVGGDPKGDRWPLAFVAMGPSEDIVRVPLSWRAGWPSVDQGSEPLVLFASSYEDTEPVVAPDGTQVAFISTRSGSDQLWIGNLEGGSVRQYTEFDGVGLTHPRWSPDGGTIALVVEEDGTSNIYLIRPGQFAPQTLIVGPSIDDRPEWAQDGSFLYFRSNRGDLRQIWKIDLESSETQLVTGTGFDVVVEPPAGQGLYGALDGLWEILEAGGPIPRGGSGIYRIEAHDRGVFTRGARDLIQFYRYDRQQIRPLYQLDPDSGVGFSVSPDLQWLYTSRPRQPRVDILVAENLKQSLR